MVLPETFTHFARTAAEQLRWKAARPLVEDELLTHLCDQRDALMAGGMDEAAAAAESLRLTGDPYEIGTALDRVHRPKTPKLLFVLAALIALAGLAFTALVSFRDYELSYFAVHQSVALLLGTAALLAAYFLDFTLLGRFALPLALMFHAALIPLGLLPIGGFWLFHYTYVSTHILLRGLPPLLPLMFASGVGANGNSTLGTGAVGGMIVGTLTLLFLVPSLWMVFQKIQERFRPLKHQKPDPAVAAEIEMVSELKKQKEDEK